MPTDTARLIEELAALSRYVTALEVSLEMERTENKALRAALEKYEAAAKRIAEVQAKLTAAEAERDEWHRVAYNAGGCADDPGERSER